MLIAADYPFMDVFWSMLVFFLWVAWLLVLFRVFADIFRRHDTSGWGKAAWCVFVIIVPFLGVLVYLIAEGQNMAHRDMQQARPHGPSSTNTSGRSRPHSRRPGARRPRRPRLRAS